MSGENTRAGCDQHDAMSLEMLLAQLGKLSGDDFVCDTIARHDHKHSGPGKVSVGDIIHVVGDRSFAPLLMLVGMLLVSPLSGVPTFPSLTATVVGLVTVQMLFGRRHFWLPSRLLKVRVPHHKFNTALRWLQRPARFVDRLTRPRLTLLVRGPSSYIIAAICLSFACLLPVTELILFSSSAVGVVLLLFGIALVSRDGLLALLGYCATASVVWAILSAMG